MSVNVENEGVAPLYSSPLLRNKDGKSLSMSANIDIKAGGPPPQFLGRSCSAPSPWKRTDDNSNDEDVNCTVFEVEEFGSKRFLRLEVIEPVTLTAKNFLHLNTSFTTYLIRIETNHYAFSLPISEVRRRYSEFVWLRRKLCVHHPNKVVPPIPPKKYFNITRFNGKIINERRYGLGRFLQRVFRSSVLLSDSALHLFLQTNLTTDEIDERISYELGASSENRASCSVEEIQMAATSSSPSSMRSMKKHPLAYMRPYLFRSVSLSSDAEGEVGGAGCGGNCSSESELDYNDNNNGCSDNEDYCDISSSEELEINVEA